MAVNDDTLIRAERLLRSGNLRKAEELCLSALAAAPADARAHRLLGRLYHQSGALEKSVAHLEQALAADPADPESFLVLGRVALSTNNPLSAVDFLRAAVTSRPDLAEAHYHLGLALQQLGENAQAIPSYRAALAHHADLPEAHNNLGHLLFAMGDFEGARHHLREALRLRPGMASASENLAALLIQRGDLAGAAEALEQLAATRPKDELLMLRARSLAALAGRKRSADELVRRMNALIPYGRRSHALTGLDPRHAELIARAYATAIEHQLGRAQGRGRAELIWRRMQLREAAAGGKGQESELRELLEADPALAAAWLELALMLFGQSRWEESREAFARTLELDPGNAEALNGQGAILMIGQAQADIHGAIACFERALAVAPQHPSLLANLGLAYLRTSDARAVETLRRATQADPNNGDAHNNLSLALLASGALEEGWKEHEWRVRMRGYRVRPFPWPQWQGEPLAGKTILAHAEQGLGDEILFATCLPDLIARGGRVIVECDPRLVPVLARSFPDAVVRPRIRYESLPQLDGLPTPDFHVPFGSLPLWFRRRLEDFPEERFLEADPQRLARWRERLAAVSPGPKIGFSWRSGLTGFGRPSYPDLGAWRSLFEFNPGCLFVDLQYDDSTEERVALARASGIELYRPQFDLRNDLDELAALLGALDLVITIGNINAPFAAALGRPVWRIFNTAANDSMRLGADCYPWFPSMTVVEQTRPDQSYLMRLVGAWQRQFRTFAEAGADSEAVALGADGRAALALRRLAVAAPTTGNATLRLFLHDLLLPSRRLPENALSHAEPFGRMLRAFRGGQALPADAPCTPDTLYYHLATPLRPEADLIGELARYIEEGIPMPDALVELRSTIAQAVPEGFRDAAGALLLKRFPHNPEILGLLAVGAYVAGDFDAARAYELLRLHALDPDAAPAEVKELRRDLAGPFFPNADTWNILIPALAACSDTPREGRRSPLRLCEDGREIGAAHTWHRFIGRDGGYSHWGDLLIFATSDRSDPNLNGRRYAISLPFPE